jgi:hypothetical protein
MDDNDFSYAPVSSSKRSDCAYAALDKLFLEFCYRESIDLEDFSRFLKALCLFSMTSFVLFQQYELFFKNKFPLEGLINSELRYIKKVVF